MVDKITPAKGEVHFIAKNSMFHFLEGSGGIEVDFKKFHDWDDKLIFLEKGQYIKFLSDDFLVRRIRFEDHEVFENQKYRVLFKHLVSLGYIDFEDCQECRQYLETSTLPRQSNILDVTSHQWFWQNPFKAEEDEYHLIFDIKEIIDSQFKNHLSVREIMEQLTDFNLNPQRIMTEKVGVTIKSMQARKVLSETQKAVAFSPASMKEIAYEYGFNDPAYFHRFFKNNTGVTPVEFRNEVGNHPIDTFIDDIYELISTNHQEHRAVAFYADKVNVSVDVLSKRVREQLNVSIGQLIRIQLIKTAKNYLKTGMTVKEVARLLHFEEPNHFSAFFKHYTGATPSSFITPKVQ